MNVRMMPPLAPMGQQMSSLGQPTSFLGQPMPFQSPTPMAGPMPMPTQSPAPMAGSMQRPVAGPVQGASSRGAIDSGLGGFGGSASGRAGFRNFLASRSRSLMPALPSMPSISSPRGYADGGIVSGLGSRSGGGGVPRFTEIASEPHMLAYISPSEAALLRGLGGTGQAGPGGVPAYPIGDWGWGGSSSSSGTTFSSSVPTTTSTTSGIDLRDEPSGGSYGGGSTSSGGGSTFDTSAPVTTSTKTDAERRKEMLDRMRERNRRRREEEEREAAALEEENLGSTSGRDLGADLGIGGSAATVTADDLLSGTGTDTFSTSGGGSVTVASDVGDPLDLDDTSMDRFLNFGDQGYTTEESADRLIGAGQAGQAGYFDDPIVSTGTGQVDYDPVTGEITEYGIGGEDEDIFGSLGGRDFDSDMYAGSGYGDFASTGGGRDLDSDMFAGSGYSEVDDSVSVGGVKPTVGVGDVLTADMIADAGLVDAVPGDIATVDDVTALGGVGYGIDDGSDSGVSIDDGFVSDAADLLPQDEYSEGEADDIAENFMREYEYNLVDSGDSLGGVTGILDEDADGVPDLIDSDLGLGTDTVGSRIESGGYTGVVDLVESDPISASDDMMSRYIDAYGLRGRRGETPNAQETAMIRDLLAGARHEEDGPIDPSTGEPIYEAGDLVYTPRPGDTVEDILFGVIDAVNPMSPFFSINDLSASDRARLLDAYRETGEFVYGADGTTIIGIREKNWEDMSDSEREDEDRFVATNGAEGGGVVEIIADGGGGTSAVDPSDVFDYADDAGYEFTDEIVDEILGGTGGVSGGGSGGGGGGDTDVDDGTDEVSGPPTLVERPIRPAGGGGDDGDDASTPVVLPDVAALRVSKPKFFARGGAVTPNIDRFFAQNFARGGSVGRNLDADMYAGSRYDSSGVKKKPASPEVASTSVSQVSDAPEEAGFLSVLLDMIGVSDTPDDYVPVGSSRQSEIRRSGRPDSSLREDFYPEGSATFTDRLALEYNYPSVIDPETNREFIDMEGEGRFGRPEGRIDLPTPQELEDTRAHMLGLALMSRGYGPKTAQRMGGLGEYFSLGSAADREMDIRNNELGIDVMRRLGSDASVADVVRAVDDEIFGQLDVLMDRSVMDRLGPEDRPAWDYNWRSPDEGPDLYFPRDEMGYFSTGY